MDLVIHTAAARPYPGAIHDDAGFYWSNAEGTGRLAAAAREAGVTRFIYLSSMAIYGTPASAAVVGGDPGQA